MNAMKRIREEATAVIIAPGHQAGESFVGELRGSVMYLIRLQDYVR
jgi:hypothetical protein